MFSYKIGFSERFFSGLKIIKEKRDKIHTFSLMQPFKWPCCCGGSYKSVYRAAAHCSTVKVSVTVEMRQQQKTSLV